MSGSQGASPACSGLSRRAIAHERLLQGSETDRQIVTSPHRGKKESTV